MTVIAAMRTCGPQLMGLRPVALDGWLARPEHVEGRMEPLAGSFKAIFEQNQVSERGTGSRCDFPVDRSHRRLNLWNLLNDRGAGAAQFDSSANASRVFSAPAPVAMTMNWRPVRVRYVIGSAVFRCGIFIRHTSRPLFVSNA